MPHTSRPAEKHPLQARIQLRLLLESELFPGALAQCFPVRHVSGTVRRAPAQPCLALRQLTDMFRPAALLPSPQWGWGLAQGGGTLLGGQDCTGFWARVATWEHQEWARWLLPGALQLQRHDRAPGSPVTWYKPRGAPGESAPMERGLGAGWGMEPAGLVPDVRWGQAGRRWFSSASSSCLGNCRSVASAAGWTLWPGVP